MADILALDIKNILNSSQIDENSLLLPTDLGDMYKKVDAVLKRCGGRWNTKQKCHLFAKGTELLKVALSTDILPPANPLAFFPTPLELAKEVLEMAGIRGCWDKILEPSAGHGVFAKLLRDDYGYTNDQMDLVEYDPYNCIELREQGFEPYQQDFRMEWKPDYQYDCVIMNPPFSLPMQPNAHVWHFLRAYELWNGNGSMVAILPPKHILEKCDYPALKGKGATKRGDNEILQYQEIIESHGHTHLCPEKAFASSGTVIDTVVVVLPGG